MSIRSKFMSMVSAFITALFSSDSTRRIVSQEFINTSAESSSSDYGSIKENEEDVRSIHSITSNKSVLSNKTVLSNKSITSSKSNMSNESNMSNKSNRNNGSKKTLNSANTLGSLEPIFENHKSAESDENSSGTNDFTSQLETTDYVENYKNSKGRHKALSPMFPYRATQKVFKDYVSPNPFFNFLRDFRFNEKNKNQVFRITAVTKKAGKEWRKMSPDEKVYYRAQAQAAKERLKMVASKILKRYPSRKFLSKKESRRRYSRKSLRSLSYIS